MPDPLPSPRAGEIYRHLRTARLYQIVMCGIEGSGRLRDQMPVGWFHLYRCMESGTFYLRATHYWELESQGFELIDSLAFLPLNDDE